MTVAKGCLWCLVLLTLCAVRCWSQTESPQTSDLGEPDAKTPMTQAAPEDRDQPTLDQSTLGFGFSSLEVPRETASFLLGDLNGGESAQWDPNVSSSTPISGDLKLLKFWSRSVTSLEYVGGAVFYRSGTGTNLWQIQQFTAAQRFLGRTRQLTLTDSLGNSNAGGSFGSSLFGGGALYDVIFAGTGVSAYSPDLSLFSGGSIFGGVGSQITNVFQADFTQNLNRRSALGFVGAYGVNAYFDHTPGLVNANQYSIATHYSYQLNRRSAVGLLYAFRKFQFPSTTEGALGSNVVQISYQRLVSRHLSFALGAGPTFDAETSKLVIPIINPPLVFTVKTDQINISATGSFGYAIKNGSISATYNRLTTNGSGLYPGANTDVAGLSIGRRVGRVSSASLSGGYSRLQEVQHQTPAASSYQFWFAGAGLTRSLAGRFGFFAGYQFTVQNAAGSLCQLSSCNYRQSIITIGLSWHARPIRLGHGSNHSEQQSNSSDGEPGPGMDADDSTSPAQNGDR